MLKYDLQFFGGRGASGTMKNYTGKKSTKTYKLYHGSPNSEITEFLIEKAGTNTSTGEKLLFFTDSKEFAEEFSYERIQTESILFDKKGKKGKVYDVEVQMKKPLDLTKPTSKDIENIIKLSDGEIEKSQVEKFSKGNNQLLKSYIDLNKLSKYGYDGLIAKLNKSGALEYGVINNKQVKIRKK